MSTVPGCGSAGRADLDITISLPGGELELHVEIEWGEPQPTLPIGSVYVGTTEVNGREVLIYRDPEGNLWLHNLGSNKFNKVTKGQDKIQDQLDPPPPGGGGGRPELVPVDPPPPIDDGPVVDPVDPFAPADTQNAALIAAFRMVLSQMPPDDQVALADAIAPAIPGLLVHVEMPVAQPSDDMVVVTIDDATLDADEDIDQAELWFVLPNIDDIEVLDPATTPFTVDFDRVDLPNGKIEIRYVGTINDVLGAAMYQGVRTMTFAQPVGMIELTIDASTSSVAADLNGAPAPAPYDLILISTPEATEAE